MRAADRHLDPERAVTPGHRGRVGVAWFRSDGTRVRKSLSSRSTDAIRERVHGFFGSRGTRSGRAVVVAKRARPPRGTADREPRRGRRDRAGVAREIERRVAELRAGEAIPAEEVFKELDELTS